MLAGSRVVITGAGGVLGRALAKKIALQHAVIIAVDKEEAALKTLQKEITKQGGECSIEVCDLLNHAQLQKIVPSILKVHKRIDIWVNNAGSTLIGSFLEESEEDWERVVELNFLSAVRLSRLILPVFEKQGRGQLVNVASVAGIVPSPWMTAYSASKHALVGFTRALEEELRQQNAATKTLLVLPGFFESSLIRSEAASFPEWMRPMLSSPQHVAEQIFFAIEKSSKEVMPTWNGKVMSRFYQWFPQWTLRGSKALLTDHPTDLLLNRYKVPKKKKRA